MPEELLGAEFEKFHFGQPSEVARLSPNAQNVQHLSQRIGEIISRETELAESFPMHVVCAWIGNSQPVAMRHYLQVTEAHFQKAAQKAAQQAGETDGNGTNASEGVADKSDSSDSEKP